MLRFGSSLYRVRLAKTSVQPVGRTWTRNYAAAAAAAEDTKRFIDVTRYETDLVKILTDEAFKAVGRADLTDLTQGFRMAADAVVRNLNSRARKISTFEEIVQVGITAANGDREIGELVAKAFEKGWENDLIIVFGRETLYNELKFVKGMKLEWGAMSPYFFTYKNKRECVLDNAFVFICEMKISNLTVLKQAILQCAWRERPLLIVAEDIENEALGHLVSDSLCTDITVCVVKASGLGEDTRAIMEDLAILTGGQVLSGGLDKNSTHFVPLKLGSCKRVIATMDNTLIVGGAGKLVDIQERCEQLRLTIKLSTSNNMLKDRLSKLSGGFAVLKVHGHGRADVREKKLRITNAVHAVKAAKEEGIVPGGGIALFYASKELDKLQTENSGQKIGVQIVQNALKVPAFVTASDDARVDGSVMDKQLKQEHSDLGCDPARGKYTEMFNCGLVDPLKLVRSEFMNAFAVSMISLKYTT